VTAVQNIISDVEGILNDALGLHDSAFTARQNNINSAIEDLSTAFSQAKG
jgi:hypothetical protein